MVADRLALEYPEAVCELDHTNAFELPGGPVGRLAGRVASAAKGRAEAEKSLANLKQLLES